MLTTIFIFQKCQIPAGINLGKGLGNMNIKYDNVEEWMSKIQKF